MAVTNKTLLFLVIKPSSINIETTFSLLFSSFYSLKTFASLASVSNFTSFTLKMLNYVQ